MIRSDEFQKWRRGVVSLYANKAADTLGGEPDLYLAEAERQTLIELPNGLGSKNQEIYIIEVDGKTVGSLWARVDVERGRAFILSIEVDVKKRMLGIGLQVLRMFERSLRERGVGILEAHFFGVDRALVDRLTVEGFHCSEYVMEKHL